ncbi:MAG: hypothetical protein D6722_26250 [Bacteroidetes bacterium]|nr:MAG: hypothetical protein D6722_26250 [Bacteroidota bacterium]
MNTPWNTYKGTYIFLITLPLLLMGCRKEKDTLPARIYHSFTSFFNGYYNADYLFNETIERLEESYVFADNGFIEVIYYGTEDEIKSYDTDFETVIKKNDAVMFKHPNGKYIDDCRILNGKSWFYRQNYTLAMQNFQFVHEAFPGSPRLAENWFWIAKTFYMQENYEMARDILRDQVLGNDTLEIDDELAGEIALFQTRLAIEAKEYSRAVRILEENVEYIKGRDRRARAHFLLGQLHTELNEYPKALTQYTEVTKVSNNYDLAFEAMIKIARLYVNFQEGQDDDSEVYKYLTKLLKDDKNETYRDRIYYEFALLELKKENRPGALDYLQESLWANINNQRQKALSYYKTGQIYFYDYLNYGKAQAYYDSAASVITPASPEYDEITALAATLKEYITYKTTIAYQDSMLALAAMPEAELDALIDGIVAEKQRQAEEEARRLLEEMNSQADPFFNPALQGNQGRRNNQQSSGTWYFDNPSAVSNGRLQFQQTWGNRKNEDNWRRSRKALNMDMANSAAAEEESEPVDSTLLAQYGDKYQYYKDIPFTDEQIADAHASIQEALYKLGQVYAQKLNEPDSAIQTFERLLDRYGDDTEFSLQSRYALYQLYISRGNPLAQVHKNYILNEHPETVYAYLIQGRDPEELYQEEADLAFAYGGLFNAYAEKRYETALGFSGFLLSRAMLSEKLEDLDLARLYYIRGMSFGYLGEKDSLAKILTYVVNTYPEHEVTPIARRTLGFMDNPQPAANQPQAATAPPSQGGGANNPKDPRYQGFTDQVRPNDKIFVLLFVPKDQISKNDATTRISDFNKKGYSGARLKVFTFLYKQSHLLPYISQFGSVAEAKKYITDFQNDPLSQELLAGESTIFYITHTNFKVAYGQKRMEDYIAYFQNILK